MSTPELGTMPVASTTRSASLVHFLVEDQVLEFHLQPLPPLTVTSLTAPLVKVMPFCWPLR